MKITYLSRISIVVLASIMVCAPCATLVAATDQFTITQSVMSADTIPPSIPANVVATGVSTSEIDLNWDASTDNVGVAGYQLFRNGTQIATTSFTNYADTGLLAGTSYDYTVTAFDAAGNFSTSSATTTGTTNTTPTTQPSMGGNASIPIVPTMSDFKITLTEHSAALFWRTSIPTRSVVSWGKTTEYEIASLAESVHLSAHAPLLENLQPGVKYYFKILARDREGNETVLKEDSFVTVALPDTEAPPNVHDFRGRIDGTDGVLSWKNPDVPDFAKVRIVRNDTGYPRDPADGTILYEGTGEEYRDRSAFPGDVTHYYALFAYDQKGNESSGAVVRLEKKDTGVRYQPHDGSVIVDLGTKDFSPLRFEDLEFTQNGHAVSYIGTGVPLDATKPFTVFIPYDRLPEHLKTILVTFAHPSDASLTFSFLLRVNKGKTAYEATIDSLETDGQYALALSVLDYKERTISKVAGHLEVTTPQTEERKSISLIAFILEEISRNLWFIVASLFLVLVAIYFATKRSGEGRRRRTVYAPLK